MYFSDYGLLFKVCYGYFFNMVKVQSEYFFCYCSYLVCFYLD